MTATKSEPTAEASLGRVTYYLALLFILTPVIDFIANVYPLRPGDLHWRYGTMGLISGFLLTPVMGLLIATFVADRMHHAGVLRFLGVFNILGSVLLFVASALFVLDLLQVRAQVPADARATFDLGTFKALAKNIVTAIGLGWLGLVSLRIGKGVRATQGRRDSQKLFRAGAAS